MASQTTNETPGDFPKLLPTADALLREQTSLYRMVHGRRWAYFTTLLILQVAAVNNWDRIFNDQYVLAAVGSSLVVTALCLLMLISRIRMTIQKAARWVNAIAEGQLVATGRQGFAGVFGVTLWVYLPFVFVIVFWLAAMISSNQGQLVNRVGIGLPIIAGLMAMLVHWRCPAVKDKLILKDYGDITDRLGDERH
jgi:hypothetical protein